MIRFSGIMQLVISIGGGRFLVEACEKLICLMRCQFRMRGSAADEYCYILQVQQESCFLCGGCQARSKALDSGSSHEGVRGFESHPPH
jgi:hypothetical protein